MVSHGRRGGVGATTGGAGGIAPGLTPRFPGDDARPYCLGVVHHAGHRPSERPGQRDPDGLNRSFTGIQVYGGWRFSFRVSPRVAAIYTLSDRVEIERWRGYRERARAIYAWLKTPPAARDEDRAFSF